MWAQEAAVPRLAGPVEIDGRVDEAAWETARALPLVGYQPVYGAAPSEASDVRVASDGRALYIAARFTQTRVPVTARSRVRDEDLGDDLLGIALDPLNSDQTGLLLAVNPNGVRLDWALRNDSEVVGGVFPFDGSWNGVWDAAARRTPDGWSVEVRIPLATLGVRTAGGEATIGIGAYRLIAAANERLVFPDVRPDYGVAFAKPSLLENVRLTGVDVGTPVAVSPSLRVALDQTTRRTASGTYERPVGAAVEPGLDVRLRPRPSLALDLTVNPDFSVVEADEAQVNLTRFALFFPEKRPFFQERAELFDVGTGGPTRLFYSRRIGIDAAGPVRVYGGARLAGRVGVWDVGGLALQTAPVRLDGADDVPTRTNAVARVRRSVGTASTVGALATVRAGWNGDLSTTAGLDADVRVVGDDYAALRLATVRDNTAALDSADRRTSLGDGTLAYASWTRRRARGLRYGATVARLGRAYDPALGFVFRSDVRQADAEVGYAHWPAGRSLLRRVTGTVAAGAVWLGDALSGDARYADGRGPRESATVGGEIEIETRAGDEMSLALGRETTTLLDAVSLPEAVAVAAGTYAAPTLRLRASGGQTRPLRGEASVYAGRLYDGRALGVRVAPTWQATDALRLGVDLQLDRGRFDRPAGTPDAFDVTTARLRLAWAFDTRLSTTLFTQWSSDTDRLGVNARVRVAFGEGHDLWLVVDDLETTAPVPATDPLRPRLVGRLVTVRYTRLFLFD